MYSRVDPELLIIIIFLLTKKSKHATNVAFEKISQQNSNKNIDIIFIKERFTEFYNKTNKYLK
jgi:hypothetical protein